MLVRVETEQLNHRDYADADELVFESAVEERYDVGRDAQYQGIYPQ